MKVISFKELYGTVFISTVNVVSCLQKSNFWEYTAGIQVHVLLYWMKRMALFY